MRKFISVILSAILCLGVLFTAMGCVIADKFKVTFDPNGGTLVSGSLVQEIESSEQLNPPTVEKEGYTFVGWDKVIAEISDDTTVKAIWEKNKFTVTFSVSGGTYDEESGALIQTVTEGSSLVLPVFTRTGYTLSWDKELKDINTTCTVNGVWTAKEYKIKFVDENGQAIEDVQDMDIAYDEKVSSLPVLPNGDKKFVGWKLESGAPFTAGQTYKFDRDVSAKAVWTDFDKYVITVNLDGGEGMNIPTIYTEGTGAIINSASRDGYTFKGWVETDKDGNPIAEPVAVVTIGKDSVGDKYYKATWEVKSYTVYFKSISGTVSKEVVTFTYGQTIEELPTVSGNDGRFVCWKYGDYEIKVGEKWTIDESGIEVNAQFIRKFVFTLNLQGKAGTKTVPCTLPAGTAMTIELDEFSEIILPNATPSDTDEYRFGSWKYADDNGKLVKLASNTVISEKAFPNVDFGDAMTINIELIATCLSNWSGFY